MKDKIARLSLYLFYVAYGLTVTLITPLVAEMTVDFGLSETQAGLINSFTYIGGVIAIVALIFLTRRLKKGWIFIVASALFVVMMYIMGTATEYMQLLAFMLILGLGSKVLDTVANALISDRYPEGTAKFTNVLHMCFSIGAFAAPIIIGLLKSGAGFDWKSSYFLFAIIATAFFVFYLVGWRNTGLSDKARQQDLDALPASKSLLKDGEFWVLCVMLFMYALHQVGITYWTSAYFETKEVPQLIADFSASALWIGIIVSRIIAVKAGKPNVIIPWVAWGSLISGAMLVLSVLVDQPYLLIASYFIAGLGTGAMIPMLIGKVNMKFPAHAGIASTVIFLFITASSSMSTFIMGGIADATSMQTAMLMGGLPLIVIFILAICKFKGGVLIKK